jgi:hypothetical protein
MNTSPSKVVHDTPIETSLVLGNRAMRAGDYGTAIDYYLKALEEKPDLGRMIEVNLGMARKLHERGGLVKLIIDSALFDLQYYSQQVGDNLNLKAAIEHFIQVGADLGLKPNIYFNYVDYLDLNPDVKITNNLDFFVDYIRYGRLLHRYYNRQILCDDAFEIRETGLFNNLNYPNDNIATELGLSPEEHYLAIGCRNNFHPNTVFDSSFYIKCYPDSLLSEKPPFLHYIRNKGRIMCEAEIDDFIAPIVDTGSFDSVFYRNKYSDYIPEGHTEILHYGCNAFKMKFDPNPNFSSEYYLISYPDIVSGFMNPLVHFCNHGKEEGRSSKLDFDVLIQKGYKEIVPEWPSMLLVCHEASRSGAPILGLQLLQYLASSMNVIIWLGKDGPLFDDFCEHSVATIKDVVNGNDAFFVVGELKKRYSLQVAILNSVATVQIAYGLFNQKIPMVSLIHEYSDYMANDVDLMINLANRVVFPAKSIKESIKLFSSIDVNPSRNNLVVRHQGHSVVPKGEDGQIYSRRDILSYIGVNESEELPAIVLGCGYVQARKGVDFFIQAAAYCKKIINRPLRFIWVGGGYHPTTDYSCSIWLRSQIIRSGLENEVFFFEEASNLDAFFELADVFFLSSRLDPFPNVAIDSTLAGVPIVTFTGATGFADFIEEYPKVGTNVPFLDILAASNAICDYIINGKPIIGESERNKINQAFDFSLYGAFVWEECNKAIAQQKLIAQESQTLMNSSSFNANFFKSGFQSWGYQLPPEYIYVAMCARGINSRKGCVGFNDNIEYSNISPPIDFNKAITPIGWSNLMEVIPVTYQVLQFNSHKPNNQTPNRAMTIGVHIHAHYLEQLPRRLSENTNENLAARITPPPIFMAQP